LPGVTHGVEYTSNDEDHGQDQPTDGTNTIDIEESNLVAPTVDSLERGEQISDHNIQEVGEYDHHLSSRRKVITQSYQPSHVRKKVQLCDSVRTNGTSRQSYLESSRH
jgi:hypothetical protein